VHRGLRRRAERAEQGQHFLLLDQPPGGFDRLRRAVGIVHGEELDLAAVDAALFVQHLEIGFADPAEHAVQRTRAAVRHGLPQLDFSVGRTGIVFFLRRGDARCGGKKSGNRGCTHQTFRTKDFHCFCFSLGMH
jgi:hypothetical protein